MPTLNWIGKEQIINHHNDVKFRVLERKYTWNADGSSAQQHASRVHSTNKIIHGDNLEALKALLPEYEGRIKCIYIDPPYNTGNENWVYNDNVNSPKIRKWLGQVVGKESEDLSRHDKWLCMMYPRLVLLQKLLSDDGAIFISIDDNEQANLKLICDEIFGARNFLNTLIWRKNSTTVMLNKEGFSSCTEYILVYKKSAKPLQFNNDEISDKLAKTYNKDDNDGRGKYGTVHLYTKTNGNKTKTLKMPDGTLFEAQWQVTQETFDEYVRDGLIIKTPSGWRKKLYLSNCKGSVPVSLLNIELVGTTKNGTAEIQKIFGDTIFSYPKPPNLIEYIVSRFKEDTSDFIILDSFAGSGTTAHAVLNLNKSDGGNRKFILVEMEDYAETITAERVRRVIDGYGDTEGTGGSFDFYELGEPVFDADGNLNENIGTEKIREYIWYSETRMAYCRDAARHVPTVDVASPYLLGNHLGTAYYFYYEKDQITTLDKAFLNTITQRAEQYVIYADNCLLSADFMQANHIIFKKIPRDVKKL